MPIVTEKAIEMYRLSDCQYASLDSEYGRVNSRTSVEDRTYHVLRFTDYGAWITGYSGMITRWMKTGGRKQYAHFSRSGALTSFIARKEKQIKILENRLRGIRHALAVGRNRQQMLREG